MMLLFGKVGIGLNGSKHSHILLVAVFILEEIVEFLQPAFLKVVRDRLRGVFALVGKAHVSVFCLNIGKLW